MHSKLGASSAERWFNCPGSVRLSRFGIPKESAYASEGTYAHTIAAEALKTGAFPATETHLELDSLIVYVDYLRSLPGKLHVEQRLQLNKDMWGTCDALLIDGDHLTVVDYKHGEGVVVEVHSNKQLLYYALCASILFKAKTYTVTVVQPRAYHADGPVRSWTFGQETLDSFARKLRDAVKRTENPEAPLLTGEHCRFCPALAYCPKVLEESQAIAVREFTPLAMTPEKISKALDFAKFAQGWFKALEEYALEAAMNGTKIPGYELVDKRRQRVWRDFTEEVLVSRFGENAYEPRKIKTPTQMEKIGNVADLWHQEKTGEKRLKQESDNASGQ